MILTRPWKIIVGIITFMVAIYPFVISVVYIFFAFAMIAQAGPTNGGNYSSTDFDPAFFGTFILTVPIIMCLGLFQLIMTIFYMIHVVINDAGSKVLRILAGIGFFFMPWLAMPAYFFIYVAPSKTPDWALEVRKPITRRRRK